MFAADVDCTAVDGDCGLFCLSPFDRSRIVAVVAAESVRLQSRQICRRTVGWVGWVAVLNNEL